MNEYKFRCKEKTYPLCDKEMIRAFHWQKVLLLPYVC